MSDSQYDELYAMLGLPSKRGRFEPPYWGNKLSAQETGLQKAFDEYKRLDQLKWELKRRHYMETQSWLRKNFQAYQDYKADYQRFHNACRYKATQRVRSTPCPPDQVESRIERYTEYFFKTEYSVFLKMYMKFMSTKPIKPPEYYRIKREMRNILDQFPNLFN